MGLIHILKRQVVPYPRLLRFYHVTPLHDTSHYSASLHNHTTWLKNYTPLHHTSPHSTTLWHSAAFHVIILHTSLASKAYTRLQKHKFFALHKIALFRTPQHSKKPQLSTKHMYVDSHITFAHWAQQTNLQLNTTLYKYSKCHILYNDLV